MKLPFNNSLSFIPLSTAASLNRIPNYLANAIYPSRARNFGFRQRFRNGTRTVVTNRRRNRNRRRRNGMEINRADGGYKNITIPYRSQNIGINTYGRLSINKIGTEWIYGFQPENDNYASHEEYNIMTMLNDSNEFKNRLKTTSQYRINGINISIFNERIPEAKDRLSRLLLYVNTTKVAVLDPKVQNNVMRLNMNTIGTKNFFFRLNDSNIGKEFTGWFDGEDLYRGNVYLHVTQEDKNNIADDTETSIILGTIKITFDVTTRIQDYTRQIEPTKKKTTEEKLDELQNKFNKMENIIKNEEEEKKIKEDKLNKIENLEPAPTIKEIGRDNQEEKIEDKKQEENQEEIQDENSEDAEYSDDEFFDN